MYKFSQEEWVALCASDEKNFVLTIRNDIVAQYPDLADDPTLLDRLNAAFQRTKELGFKDDSRVVEFLWTEGNYPGFYDKTPVKFWLSKPGKPVEERFDALIAAMRLEVQKLNRERGFK